MIVLDKLTKRFGPKILFENVSLQFDPGKRYGLTGANGAGKSTLIKMLGGEEDSDTGSVNIPEKLRLGVLKQNHFEYDKERIIDAVMMGNKALWDAMAEKERLLAGEITDEIGIRLGELEGVIAEENGYMAESEAAELLVGLGIPAHRHTEPMSTLPAGYKLRVLIAQVLFGKPDVLLLDEPTNHLDLESIRWLEDFLIGYKGTLVVISHDRHFLNAITTHIADVDYQTITFYTGNYSDFVEQKYENRQKAEAQNKAAEKKIKELQGFIDRFGSHASKSKQAQSRVKMIEKLEVKELKRSSLVRPFIRFEFEKPSGRDVLRMEGVSKSFGKKKHIFEGLNLNINRGDKIAVIGPNGIGKSTLLKIVMGETEADGGSVEWGYETYPGYFAQDHHEQLDAIDGTAEQWISQFCSDRGIGYVRAEMALMLFSGDDPKKKLSALSGGEAARLVFTRLAIEKPNVLVLDEPTNHLDLESIEALVEGLKEYNGTLIVVSHDRWFIDQLATRIVDIEPSGVTDYQGTYTEYVEWCGGRDRLNAEQVLKAAKLDKKKKLQKR